MANANPIATSPALASGLDDRSKAKLQKAVRDFESIMVGYMLKSMRSSMSTEGMFGESFGGEMLDGMFDTELAGQISQNSSLGIADMLYRKMTNEHLPAKQSVGAHHGASLTPVVPKVEKNEKTISGKDGTSPVATESSSARPKIPTIRKETDVSIGAEQPVSHLYVAKAIEKKLDQYEKIIQEASDVHGVSPLLLKAVIATESAGNVRAQSPKHAKGLMQLIDTTAADLGVQNVWDPRENIFAGAKYLQQLLERFSGNMEHAIASYNAGPWAVEKHGGTPPFPETKEFVKKVINYLQYFQQQDGADHGQD